MSSIEHLRTRVRREAVESAGQVAERVSKMAAECTRIERWARNILEGAGDGVDSDVAGQLSNAREALERAKKSLLEARKRADSYEKSL